MEDYTNFNNQIKDNTGNVDIVYKFPRSSMHLFCMTVRKSKYPAFSVLFLTYKFIPDSRVLEYQDLCIYTKYRPNYKAIFLFKKGVQNSVEHEKLL